jgi:hypothetical protein
MKNSLKKTHVLLFFFSLIALGAYAQRQTISACPSPNGGQRAHNAVMFFLTLNEMNDERIETGATTETVSQIRSVSDESICSRLNQIVFSNPKYKSVQDNLPTEEIMYFYRTNNLYYIFWAKKPEYDGKISFGPKSLFIVVSNNFTNIWEFYF